MFQKISGKEKFHAKKGFVEFFCFKLPKKIIKEPFCAGFVEFRLSQCSKKFHRGTFLCFEKNVMLKNLKHWRGASRF